MQCLVQLDVRICVHPGIGHGIRAVVDLRRAVLYNLEDEGGFRDRRHVLDAPPRRTEVEVTLGDGVVALIRPGKCQAAIQSDRLVLTDVLIIHLRLEVRRCRDCHRAVDNILGGNPPRCDTSVANGSIVLVRHCFLAVVPARDSDIGVLHRYAAFPDGDVDVTQVRAILIRPEDCLGARVTDVAVTIKSSGICIRVGFDAILIITRERLIIGNVRSIADIG